MKSKNKKVKGNLFKSLIMIMKMSCVDETRQTQETCTRIIGYIKYIYVH